MEHYIGIDVSLELSSVCVLDAAGAVVREAKVPSEPEALVRFIGRARRADRIHRARGPVRCRPGSTTG